MIISAVILIHIVAELAWMIVCRYFGADNLYAFFAQTDRRLFCLPSKCWTRLRSSGSKGGVPKERGQEREHMIVTLLILATFFVAVCSFFVVFSVLITQEIKLFVNRTALLST